MSKIFEVFGNSTEYMLCNSRACPSYRGYYRHAVTAGHEIQATALMVKENRLDTLLHCLYQWLNESVNLLTHVQ